MNDEPDEDAVRRLLADSRHTDPMPADVAARLDAVIRGLATDDGLAPVVALPRHRRRAAALLLTAAATIVVGGVTFSSLEHRGGTSGSPAGAAAGAPSTERGPANGQDSSGQNTPTASGNGAGSDAGAGKSAGAVTPQRGYASETVPVRLRAHHFAADAARARRVVRAHHGTLDRAQAAEAAACRDGSPDAGVRLPASYHGSKAVLVYRAPAGGSQVVDLYLCGARSPVRTTTLPQVP